MPPRASRCACWRKGGETGGDRLWVQFPAWIIDLAQHFQQWYGNRAAAIVRRVLQELLPLEPLH